MKVKNTSGSPVWISGYRIGPRSEEELELDEEGVERVERSSHLQIVRTEGHLCEECDRTFDTEKGLKQHETMTHGGENE